MLTLLKSGGEGNYVDNETYAESPIDVAVGTVTLEKRSLELVKDDNVVIDCEINIHDDVFTYPEFILVDDGGKVFGAAYARGTITTTMYIVLRLGAYISPVNVKTLVDAAADYRHSKTIYTSSHEVSTLLSRLGFHDAGEFRDMYVMKRSE